MSFYDERFINHPVHEKLLHLQNRIESSISENSELEAVEHLSRLVEITTYIQSSLNNIGTILVPESTLNQLNKILNNINGDINNFDTSKDINQLVAANNRADNLLNQLQQIPKIESLPDIENFSNMVTELHKSIESILKKIN